MDPVPNYEAIEVTLGDKVFTLRPALAELKALQHRVGGLIKVFSSIADRTITIEEIATIIYHGARGAGEKPPAVAELEQMVADEGLMNVVLPCGNFLRGVLVDGPKSAAAKKARAAMTPPPSTN